MVNALYRRDECTHQDLPVPEYLIKAKRKIETSPNNVVF